MSTSTPTDSSNCYSINDIMLPNWCQLLQNGANLEDIVDIAKLRIIHGKYQLHQMLDNSTLDNYQKDSIKAIKWSLSRNKALKVYRTNSKLRDEFGEFEIEILRHVKNVLVDEKAQLKHEIDIYAQNLHLICYHPHF